MPEHGSALNAVEVAPPERSLLNVPVWRTLPVGGYSRKELPKIVTKEFRVSLLGRDLMARPEFVTSATPCTIRLGRARAGDFGFTEAPYTPKFFERLGQYFYECPPETGPHLRRIYRDQPVGEWLSVFMKPITDSGGCPRIFVLADYGGLCLRARAARSEHRWHLAGEIVVRLPDE